VDSSAPKSPNSKELALQAAQEAVGDEEPWIRLRTLCELLQCSYPTGLSYIHDGKIAAVHIGGMWRIKVAEARRFIQEGDRKKKPNGGIVVGTRRVNP
jgi:excisionase family DNA binding protein